MNNSESARCRAYALALDHLKANTAITDTLPVFKEVYQSAADLLAGIYSADQTRLKNRQTGSAGKSQFQESLTKNAMIIASAIVTYAARKNNRELKESMSFNRTELDYARDADLASRAANILATARNLNGELKNYGISEELLTGFSTDLDQFREQAAKPRSQVAEGKAAGLAARTQIRNLQTMFDEQLDSLMLQFRDSHPDFYNTYIVKRTVVNPARRKTRIEGQVTDGATGTGINGVSITIKDTQLATTSVSDGSYSLKTPALSGAVLECVATGYKPFSIMLDVKLGQAYNQPIVLEKI